MPPIDYSQFSTDDLKAMQAGDISKMSTAALKQIQASTTPAGSPKQESGLIDTIKDGAAALAAGAGTGVGKMAIGAQRLIGKGIEALDSAAQSARASNYPSRPAPTEPSLAARAGKWLVADADAGRAKFDREFAPYKEASPIMGTVGENGGPAVLGMVTGLGAPNALRAAAGSLGPSMAARMAAGGATGAFNGAVTGATGSQADTLAGMLADGGRGAVSGAALGAATAPAISAITAVGGNALLRVSKSSAADYAKQKVAEAFARDARGNFFTSGQGNPLVQAAARFNKLGDEAALVDAGRGNTHQLLDTLATLPGRTKQSVAFAQHQRAASSGDRLRAAAETGLDTQGQRLPTTIEALITRRQTDSAPLYSQLRRINVAPSDDLRAAVAAADELGATKLGREISTARQMPFTLDTEAPGKWNMGDLDHVKQGIDQVLSSRKALNADGTLTPLGNAYQQLKLKLVGALDAATTNPRTGASLYKDARAAFEAPSQLIDAGKAGLAAINKDENSIASVIKGMSANELQAFRIGAFEGLRNKLGTQGGRTNIMNMWQEQSQQEKLRTIFGDLRSFREFAAAVEKESQLKQLQRIGVGSQTAARQAGMGDLDVSALGEGATFVGAVKGGNALAALGAANKVWNRVSTPQAVRDEMGRILMSRGAEGEAAIRSLNPLVQSINARNLTLTKSLGAGAGQLGGQFAIGQPVPIQNR